jgi:hypothetical protein
MEASSPPGMHHGLWYVLIYYVLEGKEKRQRLKEREKERDVNFCLNLLFIRFCFFTHSTDFIFFVLWFLHAGILLSALTSILHNIWKWLIFCYQHLLVCAFTILCNFVLCCLLSVAITGIFCLLSALIGLLHYSCIYWYLVIFCLPGS